MIIDRCERNNSTFATISGTAAVTPSGEGDLQNTICKTVFFMGIVNLETGRIVFMDYMWIKDSNTDDDSYYYWRFNIQLDSDKKTMNGIFENSNDYTFHAVRTGNANRNNITAVMYSYADMDQYNIFKDEVTITGGSEETADILIVPNWGKSDPGSVRICQGDTCIVSQ